MKRRLIPIVKLAVAAALITWLISSGRLDFRKLAQVADRWEWMLAAQIPFTFVLLLSALRWRVVLSAQGIHYSVRETFSLTMIGWVFNQLMLGTVGGDVVKAYLVAREHPKLPGGSYSNSHGARMVAKNVGNKSLYF